MDIFDGKVLIDSINRLLLPAAQFPFNVGDEVVTVEGMPVHALIASFRKYAVSANQRSTDRIAASRIVSRSQQIMPHTPDLGDAALVAVRLATTGATSTFAVPWRKSGIPIESQGPVPSPRRGNGRIVLPSDAASFFSTAEATPVPRMFQVADVAPADDTLPAYMAPIQQLLNVSLSKDYFAVLGFGAPVADLRSSCGVRPAPWHSAGALLLQRDVSVQRSQHRIDQDSVDVAAQRRGGASAAR